MALPIGGDSRVFRSAAVTIACGGLAADGRTLWSSTIAVPGRIRAEGAWRIGVRLAARPGPPARGCGAVVSCTLRDR